MIARLLLTAGTCTILFVSATRLIAAHTPWRFVSLIPLEPLPRAAPLLVAGAALSGAGMFAARRAVPWLLVPLSMVLVWALFPIAAAGTAVHLTTSPNGRFALVTVDDAHRHYLLRTTGPFGRQGRTDVACTATGGVQVRSAAFVDGEQVAFTTSDGLTWQVGFSPADLRPTRILDWCAR